MNIYKANDIRGLYPGEWDENTAFRIGYALGELSDGRRVVIGRDGRHSSEEIFKYLCSGLVERGFEILDIGMVDTPAVYYMVGTYGFNLGLMITASHNPAGYNGIKITGSGAVPVDYESGIKDIERISDAFQESGDRPGVPEGSIRKQDIAEEYSSFIAGFQGHTENIRAVFDCSNGMAGRFVHDVLKGFKGDVLILNDTVDGDFPAHGPNPSSAGSLDQLKDAVLDYGADIGFCFDGDADRVVIIDEKGELVSPDIVTALLGIYFLGGEHDNLNDTNRVLVDIRSSNSISEYIRGMGGNPLYCPVGHAKIKKILREQNAVYGGELTGHYYFRDNFFCDSAWITVFVLLKVLSLKNSRLSSLRNEIVKYAFSGELSYEVSDQSVQDEVLKNLNEIYADASIEKLDGIRFNYDDWWFIIRKSGTEPLLRLVVEASTEDQLNEKVRMISNEILKFQ